MEILDVCRAYRDRCSSASSDRQGLLSFSRHEDRRQLRGGKRIRRTRKACFKSLRSPAPWLAIHNQDAAGRINPYLALQLGLLQTAVAP